MYTVIWIQAARCSNKGGLVDDQELQTVRLARTLFTKLGVPDAIYSSPCPEARETTKVLYRTLLNKGASLPFPIITSTLCESTAKLDATANLYLDSDPKLSLELDQRVRLHLEELSVKPCFMTLPIEQSTKPLVYWVVTHERVLQRIHQQLQRWQGRFPGFSAVWAPLTSLVLYGVNFRADLTRVLVRSAPC